MSISDILYKKLRSVGQVTITPEQLATIASQVPAPTSKVDKVTGKSLVLDTEIAKIHALHADDQDLSGKSDVGHTHAYEPANSNIQTHVFSAHAPSTAQKNSDITKAEIEAQLTGEITTHTHAGGLTQQQILRLI
jgi:hypothetical protein